MSITSTPLSVCHSPSPPVLCPFTSCPVLSHHLPLLSHYPGSIPVCAHPRHIHFPSRNSLTQAHNSCIILTNLYLAKETSPLRGRHSMASHLSLINYNFCIILTNKFEILFIPLSMQTSRHHISINGCNTHSLLSLHVVTQYMYIRFCKTALSIPHLSQLLYHSYGDFVTTRSLFNVSFYFLLPLCSLTLTYSLRPLTHTHTHSHPALLASDHWILAAAVDTC